MRDHPSQRHPGGRIVVGVDGSARAAQALRWAMRQAVLTRASLEPVGCWDWRGLGPDPVSTPLVDVDLAESTRQAVQMAIAGAVAAVEGAEEVPVRPSIIRGYPPKILIECAQGAVLLVLGSRGHGALGEVLLGSVGLHCATHASCPVLIVRGGEEDDVDQVRSRS